MLFYWAVLWRTVSPWQQALLHLRPTIYTGEALKHYQFGEDHPFGPHRYDAFMQRFQKSGLSGQVSIEEPAVATEADIELFHSREYIDLVKRSEESGRTFLDAGDTPVFKGVYKAAATVVGTVLKAVDDVIENHCQQAFIPIAGLHHASRTSAAGFCVFNDCGIAIEALRKRHGIKRVAYVDIDAHHGNGVFYAFEDDPDLVFVDIHEDGHFLYPGTGGIKETGKGDAKGTKLNIPMPPGADDEDFFKVWEQAEKFLHNAKPDFIVMHCGADSLAGDPITHLKYSKAAHAFAATRLCAIADEFSKGRLLAVGGGGYNLDNLAKAWCAVIESFTHAT